VLLVDEVLAVGDESFTHKCLDKFGELHRRGKTVLIVTHALGLVERLCDDAVWLDGGEKQLEGDPKRVIGAYLTSVEESEKQQLAATTTKAIQSAAPHVPAGDMFQATEGRWGSEKPKSPMSSSSALMPAVAIFHPQRAVSIRFHACLKTTVIVSRRLQRRRRVLLRHHDIESMVSEGIDGDARVTSPSITSIW
jgi:ABC-type glutathione transport system ATPase component